MANGAIEISETAQKRIRELAAQSEDGHETGGILLGHGPDGNGRIDVEIAGDPGPKAIREPAFFLRDLAHAQRLAIEAWEGSQAIWVGEWHTHPDGMRIPSHVDLSTYLRLLAASELRFSLFVSIIVTADPTRGWSQPVLSPWLLELRSAPAPGD